MAVEVLHVSPLFFGKDGMFGGGERYALELARAMAASASTRLVSFGPRRRRMRLGPLQIDVLPKRTQWRHVVNPVSELFPLELLDGRTIHAHHYESILTDAALVAGRFSDRPVFVTDHGGRASNRRK